MKYLNIIIFLFLVYSNPIFCQPTILKVKGKAEIDSGLIVNQFRTAEFYRTRAPYSYIFPERIETVKNPENFIWVRSNRALEVRGDASVSGATVSREYFTNSDVRIKKEVIKTNIVSDVEVFCKIPIVNYKYVDTIEYENTIKKGVIAQQIEEIYPNAIIKSSRFIPNIFKMARNITSNGDTLNIVIDDINDLKIGDKLRIFTSKGQNDLIILAVNNSNISLRDWLLGQVSEVFVYGKEVHDFRSVDYNQLFMLNISATQDLLQKNKNIEERLLFIEKENSVLLNRLIKLENSLQSMLKLKSDQGSVIIGR